MDLALFMLVLQKGIFFMLGTMFFIGIFMMLCFTFAVSLSTFYYIFYMDKNEINL